MKMKDCPTSVRHRILDDPAPSDAFRKPLAKDKILAALADGPKTSKQLIEITRLTKRTIYVNTHEMGELGEIVATKLKVPGRSLNLWANPKVKK